MAHLLVVEGGSSTAVLEGALLALGYEVIGADASAQALSPAQVLRSTLAWMGKRLRLNGTGSATSVPESDHVDCVPAVCPPAMGHAIRQEAEALIKVGSAGEIRFVNRPAERLLRGKASSIIGKLVSEVIRVMDQVGESAEPLAQMIRSGQLEQRERRWLLPLDGGQAVRVSYTLAPIPPSDGMGAGALLMLRRMVPAESTSPKGDDVTSALAASLSREINNPLTYTMSALYLALRELQRVSGAALSIDADVSLPKPGMEAFARVERFLREAQEGTNRVASVMRELRLCSLAAKENEFLSPVALLDLACGLSGIEAFAHLNVVRQISPAPLVRGDKWYLARLFSHALRHALEARDLGVDAHQELTLSVGTTSHGWAQLRAEIRSPAGRETPRAGSAPQATGEVMAHTSVGTLLTQQAAARCGASLEVHEESDRYVLELSLPPVSRPV